ncbi:MAG: glycosyltransferase [Acetobacteraceae bacterium]
MVDEPLVSIAMPVRNGMPHLRQAIESISRQTYRRFELVIQDGVSTDGSLEYIRGLDVPYPVHLVSEHDGSLTAGYNRALGRCTGELVTALACDEILDSDSLAIFVSWYREHPDAVCIYGGARIIAPSGLVQETEPRDFCLIDYLRHQTCPPFAACVFNRPLLGGELRFDETLATVPDFEFFTRIALRFGEQRIIRKPAFVVTYRGDEVSMTYRPESYAQFARDKQTVIDRLLGGNLQQAFLGYLRRDLLCRMHTLFAEQTLQMPGGEAAFREHLEAAAAALPGAPCLKRLVPLTRNFRWDERARVPVPRDDVAPLPPPKEASVLAWVDLGLIGAEPDWMAAGAAVTGDAEGVRLRTANQAWHYAASVPLMGGWVLPRNSWCWLRLAFSAVEGAPMVSLFNPAANEIKEERSLPPRREPGELFFELSDPACTHLLFRNGPANAASSVLIHAIEVWSMPAAVAA